MWDATAYLKEARDAHGRWISGAGALGAAINDLQKLGDIDKATAEAVSSAIARHSEMGRGLPASAHGDKAKTLAYLAQTVKHDALTYRHQSPPDIAEAKKLDAAARAISTAHSKLTSEAIHPHADSPYRLTPDAQPLDGPSGPVKIKGFVKEDVTKLKHGDVVRVTGKDGTVRERTVYRAAPNNQGTKTVVRFKDKVPGEPNSISVNHDTRLSVVNYDNPHKQGAPQAVNAPAATTPEPKKELPPNYFGEEDGPEQAHSAPVSTPEPKVVYSAANPPVVKPAPHMSAQDLRAQQTDVKLKPDAATALKQYVTGSADTAGGKTWAARTISRKLRAANPKLSKVDTERVNAMDDAFRAVPATTGEMTLYRGIDMDKNGNSRLKVGVGDKITDNGYMSTSSSQKVARDFAGKGGDLLQLTLPAGSHPLDINAHVKGGYGNEREILIPRGAEIRVTNIAEHTPSASSGRHARVIHAELILPDLPQTVGDNGEPETPAADVKQIAADTPQEHIEAPQTAAPEPTAVSTPEPTAVTMHEKPKLRQVEELKRGDMVEVNTSSGKVIRTLDRSPKKVNGKPVLTFLDDKTHLGLKKNRTYEPGQHIIVVGRDESFKALFKSKSANEPKVVKPAAQVHAEAEPKVVKPAVEPEVVKPAESATAEIETPVGSPKLKIKTKSIAKLKNVVQVSKKMSKIKVNGANLQVGDVIEDGKLKIPTGETKNVKKWPYTKPVYKTIPVNRKIVAVKRDEGGNVTSYSASGIDEETLALIDSPYVPGVSSDKQGVKYSSSGTGYFSKLYGTDELSNEVERKSGGAGHIHTVTRLVEEKGGAGKKLKAHEQPTGTELHDALKQALDNGENLEQYDPAHRNLPTGYSVGHVQSLIHDLAVGKQNGVSAGNVKSDAAYMREMETSGEAQQIRDAAESHQPYRMDGGVLRDFKESGEITPTQVSLPHTATDEEIAALRTAMRAGSYNSDLYARRAAFIKQWMETHGGEMPSVHDFAKSLSHGDYANELAQHNVYGSPTTSLIDRNIKAPRQKRVKEEMDSEFRIRTAQRRAEEGTTARNFELPTWNDMRMEPQSFDDIQSRVEEEAKPKTIEASNADRTRAFAKNMMPNQDYPEANAAIADMLLNRMTHENAIKFADFMATDPSSPQEIADAVDKYKKPDAMVPANFENQVMSTYGMSVPEWQSISQGLSMLGTSLDKPRTYTTREYVPSFVTAGLADDGVLYHRAIAQGGSMPLDEITSRLNAVHEKLPGVTPDQAALMTKGFTDGYGNDIGKYQTWLDNLTQNDLNNPHVQRMKAAVQQIVTDASASGDTFKHETKTHISAGPANTQIMRIMKNLGAVEANDNESSAAQRRDMNVSNSGSWGILANGKKLVVVDGGEPMSEPEKLEVYDKTFRQMGDDGKYNGLSSPEMPHLDGLLPYDSGYGYDDIQAVQQDYRNAQTLTDRRKVVGEYAKLADLLPSTGERTSVLQAWAPRALRALNEAEIARKDAPGNPVRRIEYTPQTQGPDVARVVTGVTSSKRLIVPRNQRGRLSLYGYTPEEAHAKLKELGVIGDLEPQVPADQIFRGPRRKGIVSPLLSDYVRGEAQVPNTDWLASHGLTDNRGVKGFEQIFRSGGMMGIQERQNRSIRTDTTSQVGDIGSGIDHVTFTTMGSGGAVGGGSSIRLVLKPHNLIRRDVVVSPTDYGGGEDRNAKYKKYRDEIEAKAGIEVGKTTLFDPLAPAARQAHLDNMGARAGSDGPHGSDEYNVAGQITADDIHTVIVGDTTMVPQLRKMFERLKAEGIISRIPAITTNDNRGAAARGMIEPGEPAITSNIPEATVNA